MDILTTLYYLTAATPIAIAESLLCIDSIKERNYALQKYTDNKKALIDYNSETLENAMVNYSPVKRPYQQFSKADEEKLKILLHSLFFIPSFFT